MRETCTPLTVSYVKKKKKKSIVFIVCIILYLDGLGRAKCVMSHVYCT